MLELTRAPGEDWALIHHPSDARAAPGGGRHAGAGHWWVRMAHVESLLAHGFVPGAREGVEIAQEKLGAEQPASPPAAPRAGHGEARESAGHE